MIKKAAQSTDLSAVTSNILPGADNTYTLGNASYRWSNAFATVLTSGAWTAPTATALTATSKVADGAGAIAFTVNAGTALSTSGAKLLSLKNNSVEKLSVDKDGGVSAVTVAASGLISSTVASGSNFLKPTAGARLSLGSDSRYFTDDGSNILVTGGFFPSATVTYDMGSSGAIWGTAYVHAVWLNSGQIRDSSSTARITVNEATGSLYQGESAAGGVGHSFDNTTAHTGSGKVAQFKSGGNEKAFLNLDGELELTTNSKGIILKSADGTRYRLTIADGGTVSIAAA